MWAKWVEARGLRWAIVGGLLIAAAVLSSIDGVVEVCDEQLAQTGDDAVVEVCRGPSLADPAVISFFLLALVGLWPDLSEVSIGVFKLTRKVDEQVERTEEIRRDVHLLGVELRQTIAQHVSQSQQIFIDTAATRQPRDVRTAPAAEPGASIEEILAPIRNQDAYERIGIPSARRRLESRALEPVRVAFVGAAIDERLREVEAIRPQLEHPYLASGASSDPALAVANASVGHVLAIAPSAIVLPFAVLARSGGGTPQMLFEGVSAALGQRPDVLLVGLGSINPLSPDVETLLSERHAEVFIVAPAGNDGAHDAHWPASLSGVTGVAAMTSAGERAAFSNYGSRVDLAAPGVDVNSLNGIDAAGRLQFGLLTGTSPAADLVAGVAALLLATRRVPPSELRATLVQTARPAGADGLREIDTDAAVEALLEGADDG